MNTKLFITTILCIVSTLLLLSCKQTEEIPFDTAFKTKHSLLSVSEAQQLFEVSRPKETTRSSNKKLYPFTIGDYVIPDWDNAISSFNNELSSIDIPLRNNDIYQVGRVDDNGDINWVYSYSKLVAVKSLATGESDIYVKVYIPSVVSNYSDYDSYLNSDNRRDYNGLEYYTTIEGFPVAVAKYKNGKLIDCVFLGDQSLTFSMRVYKLSLLMGNTWIRRISNDTRGEGDMELGDPWSTFWSTSGVLYIVVDYNFDGTPDSVTDIKTFEDIYGDLFALYIKMCSNAGGSGSSGGGSGSVGGGSGSVGGGSGSVGGGSGSVGGGSGSVGGGSGSSGGGSGSSGGGSGSSGGGSGSSGGDSGGIGGDSGGIGGGSGDSGGGSGSSGGSGGDNGGNSETQPSITIRPPKVNPIGGLPGKDDIELPEKPKSDILNGKADPLANMEILGSLVNGVSGGRFGWGRKSAMHNGCDLKAEIGTPIFAMFDGVVTYRVDKFDCNTNWEDYPKIYGGKPNYRNAGNRLWIQSSLSDGSTILIKVFHLSTVFAIPNRNVEAGDIIGLVGTTGSACSPDCAGPHLHIEVWKNGVPIDPEPFFCTQFDENGKPIE